jgi:hypothetical protein
MLLDENLAADHSDFLDAADPTHLKFYDELRKCDLRFIREIDKAASFRIGTIGQLMSGSLPPL